MASAAPTPIAFRAPLAKRHRANARMCPGFTAIEVAAATAIGGAVAVVSLATIVREGRRSHLAEAKDGLVRLGEAAMAHAEANPANPFPESAPLTPSEVPRGVAVVDAEGTWAHPTWRALGDFRASRSGAPHRFSFAFDATTKGARRSFVARAHGDLDGDGAGSVFELRGGTRDDGSAPTLEPGMYVESEVE